jgi:hypothetical protein
MARRTIRKAITFKRAGENKMNEVRETLLEKIKYIPDNNLFELLNFIDVLTVKKTQGILLSLSGI